MSYWVFWAGQALSFALTMWSVPYVATAIGMNPADAYAPAAVGAWIGIGLNLYLHIRKEGKQL